MKPKSIIHHAKTIDEAIDDLEEFLSYDLWHSITEEFASEKDMLKYIKGHFKILRDEIKLIRKKK